MNSASLPTPNDTAAAGPVAAAAPGEPPVLDPALAAAQAGAPLPFLQFIQLDAALPAQPEPGATGAAADAALSAETQEEPPAAGAQAEPLLAAMSLPLMPSMMPLPAALPAAMRFGARAAEAAPAAAAAIGDGAVALPATLAVRAEAPVQAAQQARDSAPAQPPAVAPVRDGAGTDGQAANSGNNGAAGHPGFGIAAPGAPVAAPRDGGILALSGPPTAWRQNLQEALGERLSLQVGRNAEQAVIRLEPPMLGRIEISIRHAAGSLEVNISATHSEVLRQLNTVSDSLRSDLAQRQYTDVSVNVTQAAPRAQAQSGLGADAQGRGRQQGQDGDERAPGAALAEANQSTTAFSLNGRA